MPECCLIQRNSNSICQRLLLQGGDVDGVACHIIGQQRDGAAFIALDLDPSQRDRRAGVALADEHDLGVINDGKAIASALVHGGSAPRWAAQAHKLVFGRVTKKARNH